MAQGERVVEAVRVQREVGLKGDGVPIRIDEWRRTLELREQRAIEDNREPLTRRECEIAGRLGVLPDILARRGVGNIGGGEEDRRAATRRRKREQENGQKSGESGLEDQSGETAMIVQHSFHLRNSALSSAGRTGICQSNAVKTECREAGPCRGASSFMGKGATSAARVAQSPRIVSKKMPGEQSKSPRMFRFDSARNPDYSSLPR